MNAPGKGSGHRLESSQSGSQAGTATTGKGFDIALCQYELAGLQSIDAVLSRADTLLDRAGTADAYILPELFTADATTPGPGELPVLTQSAFERLLKWCGDRAVALDALVVGGSAYVKSDRGPVNRVPIGVSEGTLRTYDKVRPTPFERERGIVPGRGEPPVLNVDGVDIGVLVCYDIEFPTLARATVDRGAELLAVPSWTDEKAGYQRVSRCCAARAIENQAGVVQVSAVGTHPSPAVSGPTGRSTVYTPCDDIVGPHGTKLSLPRDEEAVATSTVETERLRIARDSASARPYSDTEVFGE